MIESLDGPAIAAQILMERQKERKKTFLILEGKNDISVIGQYIDAAACELVNGFKKQNVIDAICQLEEGGHVGVCGIVDSDYDRLLNVTYDSEHVLATACHDLDILIFTSTAFDKYISLVADAALIEKLKMATGKGVREIILSAARIVGACRLTALRKGFNIYFQNMEIHKVLDVNTLVFDDGLYEYLIERSHNPKCNAKQLKTAVEAVLTENIDDHLLCQGHDVACITGIALQKLIGSRTAQQTWGTEVERHLRLAFDGACFWGSTLCESMTIWQQNNSPWRLLPAQK